MGSAARAKPVGVQNTKAMNRYKTLNKIELESLIFMLFY